MKRLVNKIVMIFMAVCIFFAVPEEVRAEKTLLPELAEFWGTENDRFYDCGTSTEDGAIQVRSNSHSLKEGDTVEVQIFYDKDKDGLQANLYGWDMDVCYDESVLEYAGISIPDEHKLKYGAMDYPPYNGYSLGDLRLVISYETKSIQINGLDKSGCVATVTFRVKKDVPSAQIYFTYISLTSVTADMNEYMYDQSDGDGYNIDVLTLNLTDTSDAASKLTLSTTPAQGSEEITVPINIEKNDGFNLLGLTLNYDASLFTYDSLEIDDRLKSKISLDSIYEAPGSGRIKASFIALEDITDVGDFLKLKLKVKDGVPAGTTSNVGVEITQVGNKAETSMSGTGTTCVVSITDTSGGEEQQPMLGDVNADKKIDLVDAVYILQNYNQVREFTNAQKTVADVSKDGNIDLIDALMILKYFNGEITSF